MGKEKKEPCINAVQRKHIEDRLQHIHWEKNREIERKGRERYEEIRREEILQRIDQIRNGSARIKTKLPENLNNSLTDVFDFSKEAEKVFDKMRDENLKKEEDSKKRSLQEYRHCLDEAILGTPEQALAVIEQFENFRP